MTLRELLAWAIPRLHAVSDTPQLDAQRLLSHLIGRPRSWLYAHDTDPASPTLQAAFERLIQRRAQGEPVAYLTGEQAFYGLTFQVTPDVLIPRPETELLIELAGRLAPELERTAPAPVRAVDPGTGSGAIAIVLKHLYPHWQVAASDISAAALSVARDNARHHRVDIDFRQGSWLTPFTGERFHLILSNPPYVAPDDPHLNGSIRFEPRQALVADNHGLGALTTLIEQAPDHLHAGGWLMLEHGWDQGEAVRTRLAARGFDKVATHRDLAGHDRVSIGQWCN